MPDGYGPHQDFMEWAEKGANDRQETVEASLHEAFTGFIEKREVEVVIFTSMSALTPANTILHSELSP